MIATYSRTLQYLAMAETKRFLTAEWRYLAMANYEVDPDVLRPHVPSGTELDFWNGRAYVSLVGFLFLRTRVFGIPIPFHINFEEANLRFYVRRDTGTEVRRGVVFVREIVPRWAIAAVARTLYNEKYASLPMRHLITDLTTEPNVSYGWKYRDRWNQLRVRAAGPFQPLVSGSEEEFITEHYWGYSAQPDGGTMEYQVEHPPWNVCAAREVSVDCDFLRLYGSAFETLPRNGPVSAFLAEGSPIVVRTGVKLPQVSQEEGGPVSPPPQ